MTTLLDAIEQQGLDRIGRLLRRLRREWRKRVQSRRPATLRAARQLLARLEPQLAQVISDSLLAAWLTGGRQVLRQSAAAALLTPPTALPATRAGARLRQMPPRTPQGPPADSAAQWSPDGVRLPIIEKAAQKLMQAQVLDPWTYEALSDRAKQAAFTIAGVSSRQAIQAVRDYLAQDIAEGGTLREFQSRAASLLPPDTLISPHILETLYRTNVARAYTAGQRTILSHPLVADEFPYLLYSAVHDSRVDPDHLAMEQYGLDGTPVYRRDDPIWEVFYPPWRWNCRCSVIPLSVADAAEYGVREAQQWLRSGVPPQRPQYVTWPPFRPPAGWPRHSTLQAVV